MIGNGIGTVSMRCHNCGFMKLYDLSFVMNWKNERHDSSEDSGSGK